MASASATAASATIYTAPKDIKKTGKVVEVEMGGFSVKLGVKLLLKQVDLSGNAIDSTRLGSLSPDQVKDLLETCRAAAGTAATFFTARKTVSAVLERAGIESPEILSSRTRSGGSSAQKVASLGASPSRVAAPSLPPSRPSRSRARTLGTSRAPSADPILPLASSTASSPSAKSVGEENVSFEIYKSGKGTRRVGKLVKHQGETMYAALQSSVVISSVRYSGSETPPEDLATLSERQNGVVMACFVKALAEAGRAVQTDQMLSDVLKKAGANVPKMAYRSSTIGAGAQRPPLQRVGTVANMLKAKSLGSGTDRLPEALSPSKGALARLHRLQSFLHLGSASKIETQSVEETSKPVPIHTKFAFLARLWNAMQCEDEDGQNVLGAEGLYRLSSNKELTDRLYALFCAGEGVARVVQEINLDLGDASKKISNVTQDLAALAKQILRNEETFSTLEAFIAATNEGNGKDNEFDARDSDSVKRVMRKLYDSFDHARRRLLIGLLKHLKSVAEAQQGLGPAKAMTANGLAVCFAPSLFPAIDPLNALDQSSNLVNFLEVCIRETDPEARLHWLEQM